MSKKNMTPLYSLMMCCYWMGFSVIMGFVSVYLLSVGFRSSDVGIAIALSGSLSAVLQPVVAAYADKPQSIGVKKLVLIVGAVIALGGGGLLVFPGSKIAAMGFYGLCMAAIQLLMPLLNAWGIGNVDCGGRLNIGLSRGFSSLAYALASFGMGKLVTLLGDRVIPFCIALFFLTFLVFAWVFPQHRPVIRENGQKCASMLGFFKKYPRYTGALLGCTLLFISHVLLNSFTFQIATNKGGGSSEMGIAMAIAALAELPTLMGFSYLLGKKGPRVWFRMAGIFFTLKALGTLLAPSIGSFYGVQLFQLLGWGLISVSSIFYINGIMSPADAVKGQAYYTMAYTLGTVIGAIIGGWLIDALGVPAMLAFSSAAGAVGTVIVLWFTKE